MNSRMQNHLGKIFIVGIFLTSLVSSQESKAVIIDFSSFPGPDNILGTSDDIPVHLNPNTWGVFFTNEFSRLSGGVGFVVDSAIGGSSPSYYNELACIYGSNYNLVTARPDVGVDEFSFANVRYRFVDPIDGVTPITISQIAFDFVPGIWNGITDFAKFYDAFGTLIGSISYIDGTGNPHISFSSNLDGHVKSPASN